MIDVTALLSEFLGTTFFVLSVLASGGNPLVAGGALALVIFLIARQSGGHVNPAVSTAMYLRGTLGLYEYLSYVASQLFGGASALYLYRVFA